MATPAFLAAILQNARETAEQGDEYVVDGRGGARLQLRGIGQRQRRKDEIDRGRQQGDDHHDQQILQGRFQQVHVVGAQREAGADDRPHQRGYEHRADDDGCGIDIEADGSQDDGESQDPDVGPAEPDGALDALCGVCGVHVRADIDILPDQRLNIGIEVFVHLLFLF